MKSIGVSLLSPSLSFSLLENKYRLLASISRIN